jgi:hypothetical protein
VTPTMKSWPEAFYPAPAVCPEALQGTALLLQILDSILSDLFLQIRTELLSILRLFGAEEVSVSAGTAVVDIPVSPHIGHHSC